MELDRSDIRSTLQQAWGKLVFRRVKYVSYDREKSVVSCTTRVPKQIKIFMEDTRPKFTDDELERNVAYFSTSFSVYTTSQRLRNNDRHCDALIADSENYAELDLENGNISFKKKNKGVNYIEIPRKSRLICGLVDEHEDYHARRYAVWFSCSEQFFKLWTCIMYSNKVFPKRNSYEQLIRKMRCNTYEEVAYRDPKKIDKYKFYVIRTEDVSRKYFYIYQAIATFLFLPLKFEERYKGWGNTFPGSCNAKEYLKLFHNFGNHEVILEKLFQN